MSFFSSNISLKNYNTFGIFSEAKKFTTINKLEDIVELKEIFQNEQCLILGGGSNILLTQNIDYPVIKNNIKGVEIVKEDENFVWLNVASGEIWHNVVMYAVNKGWFGIENLALIPGTVGAAPIQNIGAYGVEVKDTISSVQYYDLNVGKFFELNNEECQFCYRDSIFKNKLKGKFFISSVTFKLSKNQSLNVTYKALNDYFLENNITPNSIRDIANAVIAIRESKLPDPKVVGNGGSFFKNPIITQSEFQVLKTQYSDIPHYPSNNEIKIPAAWLIEQCGWKGFRESDYGVHPKQALVLVNYGNATGQEIMNLSERIIESVKLRFHIHLEREIQVM